MLLCCFGERKKGALRLGGLGKGVSVFEPSQHSKEAPFLLSSLSLFLARARALSLFRLHPKHRGKAHLSRRQDYPSEVYRAE